MRNLSLLLIASLCFLTAAADSTGYWKGQYRAWFDENSEMLVSRLKTDLQDQGLSESDAQSHAETAVALLDRCYAELDEDSAEPDSAEYVQVRLGGKTIVSGGRKLHRFGGGKLHTR